MDTFSLVFIKNICQHYEKSVVAALGKGCMSAEWATSAFMGVRF
jgi:hypothetical protein